MMDKSWVGGVGGTSSRLCMRVLELGRGYNSVCTRAVSFTVDLVWDFLFGGRRSTRWKSSI